MDLLVQDGVQVRTGARATSVRDGQDASTVNFEVAGGQESVEADLILVATGRRPATDDLGLEAAGVETGERGEVVVDEHLRTSAEGVYAVGDVNGGPQFTSVSLDDYRIVAAHRYGDGGRSTQDRPPFPTTTFLTPPLATVGMTESEARAAGHEVLVADKDVAAMAMMPRPKIVGEPRGLWRVVVDASTRQVLGAAILCVDAQEVVNTIALAMRSGTTADELRDATYVHPSTTEGLNDVLGTI